MILILPDNVSAKEKRKKTIRNPSNGEKRKIFVKNTKNTKLAAKRRLKSSKLKITQNYEWLWL